MHTAHETISAQQSEREQALYHREVWVQQQGQILASKEWELQQREERIIAKERELRAKEKFEAVPQGLAGVGGLFPLAGGSSIWRVDPVSPAPIDQPSWSDRTDLPSGDRL